MNRLGFFCFGLLFVFSVLSGAQTKVSPAGHWEGSITIPTGELKVILDLDRDAKGTWIGDIDMPEQGVKDLPLRDISVSGDSVTFGLSGGQGDPMFKGKLSADGSTLSGEFSQAGSSTAFSLKRTGAAKVVVPAKIPAIPEKFTGKWEGKLDSPMGSVRLVFNLANKEDSAAGSLDSPDQGAVGIPISMISASENSIKISVKLIPAEYNGKLSEDAKTLTGEWSQGGSSFALVLTKK
ncbi:MAG: hypothetical protein LAP85_13510 [Acidobacteriia bacterium]|nr:hypothetical protein [Terriglobia bacterium]